MAYEHGEDTENIYTYDITGVHMSNSDVYLKDGHGNIIGKHGTATGTANVYYDAFGVEQNKDKNDTNPFRYCGEYYDAETDSIYLRARYYSPTTGRFISEDPIQDGLNWYVYCGGNPVVFVDPSGLLDVPNNGTKSYIEVIKELTEIIDCKAEYVIEAAKENPNKDELKRISNQAQKARDRIDLDGIKKYSEELYNIVKKNVIDSENGGSMEQVSAVVAMFIDIREKTITGSKTSGQELIPEKDILPIYRNFLAKNTIYIASVTSYSTNGDTLARKILSKECNWITWGRYDGYTANDEYKVVIIADQYKVEGIPAFEPEDWIFDDYYI